MSYVNAAFPSSTYFIGQGLNFNSMFILVLMLRHSITKLREFGVNVVLPLDKHIFFHKITGRLLFIHSVIHTIAHIGNICKYELVAINFVHICKLAFRTP